MKKFFVMAIMMTTAIFAAAEENENVVVMDTAEAPAEVETVAEAPNMVDEVLATIDGTIVSRAFHVDEARNVYIVEFGERFIRVRDFATGKLVSTLSIYLNKENGTWIEGANNVMCYEGRFYPAKKILNGKGITYKGAKHAQRVPMNRVRSVEQEYRIWL